MNFKVGDILRIPEGKFTKVIYIKGSIYGISGWTFSQRNAEQANASFKRINKYGLRNIGARLVNSTNDEPREETVIDNEVVEPETVEEGTYTKSELEGKLKPEVVEIADELGLNKKGTKAEVIDRILDNQ